MLDITKYIPAYPQISPSISSQIARHVEFRREDKGIFYHQTLISRFMSPHTSYRSLLLFHEMGTGKTCSAVSVAESFFSSSDTDTRSALILCRGQTLIDNFTNEIVNVCRKNEYRGEKTVEFRSRYKFSTFDIFSRTGAQHPEMYSKHIIIIDEAHRLVTTGEDGTPSNVYNSIRDFIHSVDSCRVLLLTGTPMRDDPSEILRLMSLMPDIPSVPTSVEDTQLLRSLFYGRVSYVSALESTTHKVYAGEYIGGLKHISVYVSQMSVYQESEYMRVYDKKNIFIEARQVSLFAFPRGENFGSSFRITVKKGKDISSESGGKNVYVMNESLAKNIDKYGLETFSPKFKSVIDILASNPSELAFVYCEFVEGSGCILFSKILEMYGYSRSTGKDTTQGLRYAIITNKTTSEKQTSRIISSFNSRDNMYGKYIRVIIGSRVMSEGITLKNVRQVHILTPHWNYAETDQAIARSVRALSHSDLIADGTSPIVTVYHHVSVSRDQKIQSIDLHMYLVSEKKDVEIKRIERILKECAIDCIITPQKISGDDYSRECDYALCSYSCSVSPSIDRNTRSKYDNAAYLMYYSEEDIREASSYIKDIFSKTQRTHVEVPYPYDICERACEYIGRFTDTFKRPIRVKCIRENSAGSLPPAISSKSQDVDRYTLVYSYIDNSTYKSPEEGEASYYTASVVGISYNEFERSSERLYYTKYIPLVIEELFTGRAGATALSAFDPTVSNSLLEELDNDVKQTVIEACIVGEDRRNESAMNKHAIEAVKFILSKYNDYIVKVNDNVYVYPLSKQKGIVRMYSKSRNAWMTIPESEIPDVNPISQENEKIHMYAYYGVIDTVTDKFMIKKKDEGFVSDKRKSHRGRVCNTIDKSDLVEIYRNVFGKELDVHNMNKKDICDIMRSEFESAGIVLYIK